MSTEIQRAVLSCNVRADNILPAAAVRGRVAHDNGAHEDHIIVVGERVGRRTKDKGRRRRLQGLFHDELRDGHCSLAEHHKVGRWVEAHQQPQRERAVLFLAIGNVHQPAHRSRREGHARGDRAAADHRTG